MRHRNPTSPKHVRGETWSLLFVCMSLRQPAPNGGGNGTWEALLLPTGECWRQRPHPGHTHTHTHTPSHPTSAWPCTGPPERPALPCPAAPLDSHRRTSSRSPGAGGLHSWLATPCWVPQGWPSSTNSNLSNAPEDQLWGKLVRNRCTYPGAGSLTVVSEEVTHRSSRSLRRRDEHSMTRQCGRDTCWPMA